MQLGVPQKKKNRSFLMRRPVGAALKDGAGDNVAHRSTPRSRLKPDRMVQVGLVTSTSHSHVGWGLKFSTSLQVAKSCDVALSAGGRTQMPGDLALLSFPIDAGLEAR